MLQSVGVSLLLWLALTAQAPTNHIKDPLQGAYSGRTTSYSHPRGWFSFDMPNGWVADEPQESMLAVNPGLKEGDNLDAVVVLTYGKLASEERGRTVADLLTSSEPNLRALLANDAIEMKSLRGPVQQVQVGEIPGAIGIWDATAGEQNALVWVGSIIQEDYYLGVVCVVLSSAEDRFLPGVKRIYRSLRATPPNRNPEAERALVGVSFFHSESYSGGSSHVVYDFVEDGQVKKTLMMSGPVSFSAEVGGESIDWGTWEVVGDEVYLHFEDDEMSAVLVVEDGAVVGLRSGQRLYQRR